MSPTPVAVVIGLHANALGVIRSLARAGIEIIALGSDLSVPTAATSLCARKIQCEVENPDELLSALVKLGAELGSKAVLFPCGDTDALCVSLHRDTLAPYFMFRLPDHELLKTLLDKTLFLEFACQHRLPIPASHFITSHEQLDDTEPTLRYPCLVKPWRMTPAWEEVAAGHKVLWVYDSAQLKHVYESVRASEPKILVQEWIEGKDDDVFFVLTFFDDSSQPLAVFGGRKIRQWQPLLGSSSCVIPSPNPELERRTVELFSQWKFKGLGSIEWKHDARTNEYYIIEPTAGRCDLQSPVALVWGMNFPLIAYRNAAGLPQSDLTPQPTAGCWIHEERDLYSSLHYMKRRDLTLAGWMRTVRGKRVWTYFHPKDMGPSFKLWGMLVKRAGSKVFRRRSRK